MYCEKATDVFNSFLSENDFTTVVINAMMSKLVWLFAQQWLWPQPGFPLEQGEDNLQLVPKNYKIKIHQSDQTQSYKGFKLAESKSSLHFFTFLSG